MRYRTLHEALVAKDIYTRERPPSEPRATRYPTMRDVIDAIVPAFGDYGDDYDIEAIARETHEWRIDTDARGNLLWNTGGFEQTVTGLEFWEVAAKHDRTLTAPDGGAPGR